MYKINPLAIIFWVLCGLIGFIFDRTVYGVCVGVAIAIAVSLTVSIIDGINERTQRRRKKT